MDIVEPVEGVEGQLGLFDMDQEELFEEADGEIADSTDKDEDAPSIFDPEWHDYVMSHFQPNELIDGNPICAGLRRVSELLLGTIVESGPSEVFPSTDNNGPGRATVVYTVVFDWQNMGMYKTFREVADVWHGNTDDLFCAHPVATASTRAEGRALRKALRIRALAAEELAKKNIVEIVQQSVAKSTSTDGEYSPDDRITPQQIQFIDKRCSLLNIEVTDFISMGEKTYRSINDVKRDCAKNMIKLLNQYQNETKDVPKSITGYNEDWRN
ncbi:hypothetical protein CL634_08070 [bacterium]|nr:hypothetical protein [bacterium]|tara:strand:- start:238 stop:1047 length:810 start_codon:yes stop_codon:yes gene_type:complete